MNDTLPVAIKKLAELGIAAGVAPITQFEGCWEHQVDERWWVAWNGHRDERKTSRGIEVPAFTCVIEYNGWPAGMIDPHGGIIALGACANENTFIEAVEAATKRLSAQLSERRE